ncbi:MAG: zinc-dependent metalloprotease, partial [Gemmatimonadaceae bacterium]
WDPEDIRYSVVRWAASLVRNAVGPSTSDPRTGEIIESDITWYHNHMRSYRNRLMIETGAANPVARSLEIPEDLMGETMRKVITHEVGHAIGLPHNMVASSSFPVDSLRSAAFAKRYGVSATIMDYARQNYVAQPGDGLEPRDFVRRLGPFDNWVINWGYRVLPNAATPEAERNTLNDWITKQNAWLPYRYVPQNIGGIDPRSQTEDVGDDPVRATTFALANLKRVLPNLVQWTTRSGEDYEDLNELYTETLGMWSLYMGHVTTVVGGVHVDLKSAEQDGAVFRVVPKARQKTALQFLSDNVFRTPDWLAPEPILARLGPSIGATSVSNRQAGVLTQLLDARRLTRMSDVESFDPVNAYPAADYLADLRRAVWGNMAAPDPNRRLLHRVYLERLATIVQPPPPPTPAATGPPPAPQGPVFPLLVAPNVQRSDIPALARRELRTIQADARRAAATAPGAVMRAHWLDVADRVDVILDPARGR